MELRPSCPVCDSTKVLVSDRKRDDEQRAACSACRHEWTLATDWWVSILGGVIPERLDEGPATALP
jgi:hypothetical protein